MSVTAATATTAATAAITAMTKGVSFTFTNSEKVKDGQIMRVPIVVGQVANAGQSYLQSGLTGSNKAQAGAEVLGKVAEKSKTLTQCKNILKWIQGHINPLIVACVGTKILMSEDKVKALYEDGSGVLAMFAAEKAYKKLAKTNTAQKAFKYVEDLGNKTFKNVKGGKAGKICAAVAEGLGFVAASIGGYAGAAKLGGAVLENKRENVRKQFENFEMMC